MGQRRLRGRDLYRPSDPRRFRFASTAELPELTEIVGHRRAIEAVELGIGIRARGFNIYAMGPEGIGKYTFVRQFLAGRAGSAPAPDDWCYVNNFDLARRPHALRLPAGRGRRLREGMEQLIRELRAAIPAAFETDQFRNRRQALEDELKSRREQAIADLEQRALARNVAVLRTPIGVGMAPVRDGKVVEPSEFEALPAAEQESFRAAISELEEDLRRLVHREFPRWERDQRAGVEALNQEVTRAAVEHLIEDVRAEFQDLPAVVDYLAAVQRDVIERAREMLPSPDGSLPGLLASRLGGEEGSPFRRYQVNLLVDNGGAAGAPVVFEDHPTQPNLVGRVEHTAQLGALVTDFTLIRAGALHRANGGYLVLDARKVLTQPYAWDDLKRALRAGEIRIEALGDRLGLMGTVSLEPEPIPLDLKIILIGDREVYYLLCGVDPDFVELFKVEADFDDELPRTPAEELRYARLLGTLARREGLRPLDPSGAARIVEHAARLAADRERLATRLRSMVDVLREADHRASRNGHDTLGADDVRDAIEAVIRRASRVHERILDEIQRGTILVATEGHAVGQVNGLSVAQLGEQAFGWPVRITARVGLGGGEIVDIEREVELGGPIHSKGVLILAGFVSGRYGRHLPLRLRATLVFEQSYAGVEGDSASLAEACALLSAIGGIPLRQSLAVTGSVNQAGDVQPIGGVNEKIEGFFDVCAARGLTGEQGVVIPAANMRHLMLRRDVVEAVEAGRFTITAVVSIDDALELLSGLRAGRAREAAFTRGSFNARVADGLRSLAERAREFGPAVAATDGARAARAPGGRRSPRPASPARRPRDGSRDRAPG
jgi:lon-related putative ATP-dependent protease